MSIRHSAVFIGLFWAAVAGAQSPPTLTKSFNPLVVPVGGTTTVTLTLTNPNAGVTLSNIQFTDKFPAATFQFQTFVPPQTCTVGVFIVPTGY